MISALFNFFFSLWDIWSDLFSFIPYGEPYLAIATLLIGAVIIVRLSWLLRQHFKGDPKTTHEMARLEMYRKVLNIR